VCSSDLTPREEYRSWPRWKKEQVKAALIERDGRCCMWCGRKLSEGGKTPGTSVLTIEHIKTCAAGGGNELWNLGLACKRCNTHDRPKSKARISQEIEKRKPNV
jgi:5-methylcytosine-specific restriction endonuclease McrA